MYRAGFYRGGPVMMMLISGIDQALWDIFGKWVGLSVHQLLGGACRDKVRVYGGCGGAEPSEIRESARACVEAGFTAMKFCPCDATKIVDGLDVLKKVEARVTAAREGAGDADVALDFHRPKSTEGAAFAGALVSRWRRVRGAKAEPPAGTWTAAVAGAYCGAEAVTV